MSAEAFRVDNANQIGIFTGTSEQPVDVRQGDVRLQAKEIRIYYNGGVDRPEGQDAIRRLEAIGEVFITNGKESAEAARADYDVAAAEIVMDGNVRLLQGESVMKGERLRIDLEAGTGRMEGGRVQVSINPARAGQ
ncbi:MAG: LptA/OstA family protein [Pseudomonadota bacterium]